jgi:hypothetical protein
MKSEGNVKAELLTALAPLEALGRIKVIRQQSGTLKGGRIKLGKKGTPDVQVLLPNGRSMFLELKKPDGKKGRRASGDATRIAQEAWHASALKLGHVVHIFDNATDAVHAVIAALPSPAEKEKATL